MRPVPLPAAVGVDCSSKRLAIVKLEGDASVMPDVATFLVDAKGSWEQRLAILADGARAIFEQLAFEAGQCVVYIEEAPMSRSYRASIMVSYAVGSTIVEAIRAGHVVVPVNVGTWKKQTVGNGRADKDLVRQWASEFVFARAGQEPPKEQDLHDAACIAVFARKNLRGIE